jgi:glyoxylase-like metal-dependent hydrolase (beta-lactamase superfamily II)/rhodanese-related sulfurtransferase
MYVHVEIIETPELGDRSYVVHDGSVAVVIDPQRDLDRVEKILHDCRVSVGLVVETHIHNDYVTGGYELATRHGAPYALNAEDPVSFERRPVSDGDELNVGHLRVRVLATPGHTVTHLAYVITDSREPDAPTALFSGGSLLYGSVGRTDLVDVERTRELTHAQFHSARRLAAELAEDTTLFPTHGFGSFCSSGAATGGQDSTIGTERHRNDALTSDDEDGFVERLVAALTAYPAYYAHMAPLNLNGPREPGAEAPHTAKPDELAKRIEAGEWVVDLRTRTAYAADHVAGSISIELGQHFATYLGWLMPWGSALTVLGDTPDQVRDAQRQLLRIGIDHIDAAATGPLDEAAAGLPRASYPRSNFIDAATRPAGETLLDVRRDDERVTSHIDGSVHIPMHQLLNRLDEVPDGRLWVHCASGFRAGIASSLLDRAGHDVVHIDDDYSNAAASGLRAI